ncbi:hypothetical protein GGS24DRAFT_469779 [Hypoxylon argillaceum]|nr:hypothetical protein GGS24DRAFT_469779 [Hypoxylon argillaceum]
MDFTYSDLKPGQIRLLRPVMIQDGSFIALEMADFPRNTHQPYAAVSYTWGDDNETSMVQLNGRRFRVQRNLWTCLNYLGLNAQHSKARYLWVDAICINQENISERNAQVRVMDEIYKNALYVSIWLGLDPRIEIYRDRIGGPIRSFDADDFYWFEYVKKLADHEYWSRYWVIQECLLARDIQVHCGRNIAPWEHFREALSLEAGLDLYTVPENSHFTETLDARKHGALPLLLARLPGDDFLPQRPLDELIIHHRHSRCKDPRDRVFALLGLLPPGERASLERFFPNYSLSYDAVVVITLAHLQEVSMATITMESQKLFQGLGVESKERQRRLIAAVRTCPYYYDSQVEDVSDEARQARARYLAVDDLEYDQFGRLGEDELPNTDDSSSRCDIM